MISAYSTACFKLLQHVHYWSGAFSTILYCNANAGDSKTNKQKKKYEKTNLYEIFLKPKLFQTIIMLCYDKKNRNQNENIELQMKSAMLMK